MPFMMYKAIGVVNLIFQTDENPGIQLALRMSRKRLLYK